MSLQTDVKAMVDTAWPLITTPIANALDGTGGSIVPEIKQELDAIRLTDWPKADAVIELVKLFESREAAATAEAAPHLVLAAPLLAKAKAASKAVDALKGYLKERMKAEKLDELDGPLHKARLQKNGQPKFELVDPEVVPAEVAKTVTVLDVDMAKVLFARKQLPAGVTGEVGVQLRIDR